MRNIVILGSSGSIGRQAVDVIARDPELRISGLAVRSSISLLREQTERFRPEAVCVFEREAAERFSSFGLPVRVLSGMEGLIELSEMEDFDDLLVSLVGMIGIEPTIAAIRKRKRILLANKETLVCAGHLIMPLLKECRTELRPIDSEHSAIWQSLMGEDPESLERILLTASGGPFRGLKREELKNKTKEDALKHPNWSMGRKITVDSATLINKGLEFIEAKWLFSVPPEKITVLIQPESIIHSAVQFKDGSVKAQLGAADMRIPIEYALYAPSRRFLPAARLDFAALSCLHFERPDTETFRGLFWGIEAGKRGGSLPTIYNAANEEAVASFLRGEIGFLRIAELVEEAMRAHEEGYLPNPDLSEILEAERWAREFVRKRKEGRA
ncbi:1-deoxy-D-xylulose 5-phosphate reductoisomerase [Oribacterium sp. oral taxon 078 str. F0263]|uniref:1-deoxy-D-xylulose-5-phosphate reductoisomerase n=1 Tax=Oribacterium sp. oral taxon 078 TaxID=652706 RepID=UPI0003ADF834|nr:1-deoxy-D-xylulose-5-phosphate reductoisomerase [Oribacterium sp. oral taxon 078]ERL05264.1 1-deoxy-D-xylulose 5-phosphate reductoisomerase [Oribacterium sp. oral taxon 078 str. F0263]